jgi:hypothetical protein
VCSAVLHALVAGMLARSPYPEGPATGQLGFAMSKRLKVATVCFSCSPSDLNFLDPYFIFM